MAMAMLDSVTVSMGDDTMGTFSGIFLVKRDDRFTSSAGMVICEAFWGIVGFLEGFIGLQPANMIL